MIYVPANSSEEGMIKTLNSHGISSTDCSVSALPQIYTVIYIDGVKVHNLIINNESSYIFEKQDDGIFKMIAINPTDDMIKKCSNVSLTSSKKYIIERKKESYVFIYSIIIFAVIFLYWLGKLNGAF